MVKRVSIVLLAVAAFSAALPLSGGVTDTGPRWLPNYPEARDIARETGRPLFVTFR